MKEIFANRGASKISKTHLNEYNDSITGRNEHTQRISVIAIRGYTSNL